VEADDDRGLVDVVRAALAHRPRAACGEQRTEIDHVVLGRRRAADVAGTRQRRDGDQEDALRCSHWQTSPRR
jgi:hypothetical protein